MPTSHRLLLPPIPPLSEPPNWSRLPIHECGEPLVPLDGQRLRLRSLYAEQGLPGATSLITVRTGVRDRLYQVADRLPAGIQLCLFDGYRPLAVQQALYDSFAAELRARHPELTEDALHELIGQYVASPTAAPACPPPHRTGGAVDVYLVDAISGTPLPMGTEPDETTSASATGWFEEHPEEPFTSHRRLLFHAMTEAGFTNYLGEWWHYDFGNQRWANATGQPHALYGIAPEAP